MSVNQWVYRIADGQLCLGDGPDPVIFLTDPVNYALIDLGAAETRIPDPRTQRVVHATQQLRAATAVEIAAFDRVVNMAAFSATSRKKDQLADAAMWVRERDVAAWSAMTALQKRAAVIAAADVWRDLRSFIEDNT